MTSSYSIARGRIFEYVARTRFISETEAAKFHDDRDILDFSHVFCHSSISGYFWYVLIR